ncbi:MAG: hypothetical protein JWN41_339 [Thermoleophilia bacterium]|nr:hypothetical protein [Thermoleophilia bacterium]
MTHTTVIVSDVHARKATLERLLERVGVMHDGRREAGFWVVQIGDLVNLGYGVAERDFLEQTWDWFDEHLAGNHELPALQDEVARQAFGGWNERDEAATQFVADHAAEYRAASAVGPWLITHAGLSAHHHAELVADAGAPLDARELADAIDRRYRSMISDARHDALIDGVGAARGGSSQHPGVLWIDARELVADYEAGTYAVNQIVGHTPTAGPKLYADGKLWCIDTPEVREGTWGGVAALVTRDDGRTFDLVWER